MKYKVSLIAILLTALAIPQHILAYDFSAVAPTGQTLYYTILPTNNVCVVPPIGYNGTAGQRNWDGYNEPTGALMIPDSVTHDGSTYYVTAIGARAFDNCDNIVTINIPSNVTSIGKEAFYFCDGLTNVTIPYGVTSIGEKSFHGCSNLTSVTISSSVTSIDRGAFASCTSLSSVTLPNSISLIDCDVFKNCVSLTSISIPNSVTTIAAGAFEKCGLTQLYIPSSVTSIGQAFFECNNLTSIIVDGNNPTYDSRNNCNAIIKKSTNTLIVGCKNTIIPENVSHIGAGAFERCSELTTITIPNSVTSISSDAFRCSGLTIVSIPNSVLSIGGSAFSSCTELTSVSVGSGVTEINYGAFSNCTSLTDIYMNGYPPSLVGNTFPSTANIHIRCVCAQEYLDSWGANYNYIYPTGAIPEYSITLNGQASIVREVDCDSTVIIKAAESTHTLFDHWNDGNTDNPRTVHLTQDTAFTAYFVPVYHCEGLWYASQQGWGDILGGGKAKSGDTVMLTAVPNPGYHFVKWVKCQMNQYGIFSETSVTSTQNPLQQVMANQDVYWAAKFAPDTFHVQITVNDDRWGFLNVPEEQDLAYGTELVLYAFPSDPNSNMCTFVEWSDGTQGEPVFTGSSWGSKKTVTVTGDISLQAIFTSQYRTVTAVSSDETLGEIVSGSGDYQYLDTAVLRARPADHYHLTHWLIEYTYIDIDNGSTMTSSREVWNENPYYMPIDGNENNITATAYFAIDTHTVSVVSSNMMHGGVEGGGTFPYGTAATVTATAYSGYEFVRWSNGVTYNPYTFAVSTDVELTAVFAEQGTVHNITALAHDPTTGSVTGGGQYATGETATLTAVPAEGYRFVRWNDGNTDNPRLVLVVTDITYTAFFADINAIDDAEVASAKVYSHHGQIVVEGAEGQPVTLIDAVGRQLATKRDEYTPVRFDVPTSGTYLVKIGDYAARRVVVIR